MMTIFAWMQLTKTRLARILMYLTNYKCPIDDWFTLKHYKKDTEYFFFIENDKTHKKETYWYLVLWIMH